MIQGPSFTDRIERGLAFLESAAREFGAAAQDVSPGTGVSATLAGHTNVIRLLIRGVRGWLGRG